MTQVQRSVTVERFQELFDQVGSAGLGDLDNGAVLRWLAERGRDTRPS